VWNRAGLETEREVERAYPRFCFEKGVESLLLGPGMVEELARGVPDTLPQAEVPF
jgi:hypothetical protein